MLMRIEAGFDLVYDCPQPTPMVLMLSIHPSRRKDLLTGDRLRLEPTIERQRFVDAFGNHCTRILAPAGKTRIESRFEIWDSGRPDPVVPEARQMPVDSLPDEVLQFLLGSRYCDTDLVMDEAWKRFCTTEPGWGRVQAICDFVHQHIRFDYQKADSTRTASGGLADRTGVCRDFAHLAVTFCRCMNIPARYCTGYLGDIRVPPVPGPMDFSAWFEAYLGGRWYTFDARHNRPRIGRILMATGRDAADVALSTSFGANRLEQFDIVTNEIEEAEEEEPLQRVVALG